MWLPKLKGGETDLENPDLKYLGRNLSQTLHPTNYGWGEGGLQLQIPRDAGPVIAAFPEDLDDLSYSGTPQ